MRISFLRYPRTRQELIEASLDEAIEAPRVRAKRRNLPTSYSDLPLRTSRSWKVHRHTQHR